MTVLLLCRKSVKCFTEMSGTKGTFWKWLTCTRIFLLQLQKSHFIFFSCFTKTTQNKNTFQSPYFLSKWQKLTKSSPSIWRYERSKRQIDGNISSIFVAFLENMNFTILWHTGSRSTTLPFQSLNSTDFLLTSKAWVVCYSQSAHCFSTVFCSTDLSS